MPWFRWSAELVRLWKMSRASEILPRLRSPSPQAVQDPVSQAAAVAVPVVRKGVQARHERLGHFLQEALIDLLLDGGDTLVGDFRGNGIFLLVDIILDGGAVDVALQDAHHISLKSWGMMMAA